MRPFYSSLRPHLSLFMGAILALPLATGCKPKATTQAPVAQQPSVDPAPVATTTQPAPQDTQPTARPTYYLVDSYIHNLDDIFKGLDQFLASWTTSMPVGTRDLASLFLTNIGFQPAFLEQMQLQRSITAHLELPHRDEYLRDYSKFSIGLPTQEATAMVTSFPSKFQIRAIGGQQWAGQFEQFSFQMLGAPDHLAIARELPQIARAQADQGVPRSAKDNRIQFTLSQLSDEQRKDIAQSIPESLRKALAPVLKRLNNAVMKLDIGSERDMKASFEAHAPMNELNLPLSVPSSQPSALAQRLPAKASAVAEIMVGNIDAAMRTIRGQLSQVPEPFATPAAQAVDALGALGKNIEREMIIAYYVDSKNRGSLLISADFKDPKSAEMEIEKFWTAVTQAFQSHIELVGNSAQDKYKVKYKKKGARLSGVRTQQFEVTVPPRFLKDLEPGGELAIISPLISGRGKRKNLVSYSAVTGNNAVMVLGSGAKDSANVALRGLKAKKAPSKHLETNGGLALARLSTQGCQICGYAELVPLLRAVAVHAAAESGKSKDLRKVLNKIKKVKLETGIAGALRVEPNRGVATSTFPTSFVFAEREQAQLVNEIIVDMEVLELPPQMTQAQN